MLTVLLAAFSLIQSPASATTIKLTPRIVTELDMGSLGGLVRQLAWSPDRTELYLQTYEPNKDASVKTLHHHILSAKTGAAKSVDAEPAWAQEYYGWKSAKTAPNDETFSIDVAATKQRVSATSTPMGGDAAMGGVIAGGGGGASAESVVSAARQSDTQNVYTMRLKGEVVGEWVDMPIVPGQTFGWGPPGSGLIAFADKNGGRLVIMDKSGAKQRIDNTKSVVVPAWSADGSQLAYLQGKGGKKYALVIAEVAK
jgi:hypothetical protein